MNKDQSIAKQAFLRNLSRINLPIRTIYRALQLGQLPKECRVPASWFAQIPADKPLLESVYAAVVSEWIREYAKAHCVNLGLASQKSSAKVCVSPVRVKRKQRGKK